MLGIGLRFGRSLLAAYSLAPLDHIRIFAGKLAIRFHEGANTVDFFPERRL